jgi:hypothetical protein
MCRANLLDYFKAPSSGHLNIEKKHIDASLPERGNDFFSVAALPGNLDLFIFGQKKSEPFAGQGFIIGDESFQSHLQLRS